MLNIPLYVALIGTFYGEELTLLNVYAPTANNTTEQMTFLQKLIPLLDEYSHNLILGEDLNTYFDHNNKYGTPHFTQFSKSLSTIMDDLDISDIWRILNPDIRCYTWRKLTTSGLQQT